MSHKANTNSRIWHDTIWLAFVRVCQSSRKWISWCWYCGNVFHCV